MGRLAMGNGVVNYVAVGRTVLRSVIASRRSDGAMFAVRHARTILRGSHAFSATFGVNVEPWMPTLRGGAEFASLIACARSGRTLA